MGEFLYFLIYVVQQLGVMFGVGAQTVLLCTHLVAVHRGELESPKASYAHAARLALGTGLFLMIASGMAAVMLHMLNGQMEVVFAPTFLFKWALIAVLLTAFFIERAAPSSTVFYAFTGGTWYALFLVHSLGLVSTWGMLGALYAAWLIVFAVVWITFVGLMHWRRTPQGKPLQAVIAVKKEIPKPKEIPKVILPPPKPIHQDPPPPKPVFVPLPQPVVVSAPPPPKPLVVAPPPVVIKPIPLPKPAPKVEQPVVITVNPPAISWWRRLLALLPKRKSRAAPPVLPAPILSVHVVTPPPPILKPIPPASALVIEKPLPPPPPPPKPTPAAIMPLLAPTLQPLSLGVAHTTPTAPSVPPKEPKHTLLEEVIDHLLVPALRIMPKTLADIGKQNRPPVVKLGEAN